MSLLIASKKGKWIIGGVCVFALVATASTGLASWVIGQQNSANTEGNINVSTIDDQSCTVTLNGGLDLTVNFGPDSQGNKVVNASSATPEEDLSFTIAGKLDHEKGTYSKVKVVLVSSNLYSAVTDNYVVVPEGLTLKSGTQNTWEGEIDVTSKAFSKTYSFTWGTAFDGINPCKYYTGETGKTYSDAKTALTALEALNGDKMTITVSPVLG